MVAQEQQAVILFGGCGSTMQFDQLKLYPSIGLVVRILNLSSRCHESDGACTSDDGSVPRWTLIRAVAALLSVLEPLSRFAHPEVGDEVAGQFEQLFTDAASSIQER
ncbi:unnamed protein product [Urochloa humidicola]